MLILTADIAPHLPRVAWAVSDGRHTVKAATCNDASVIVNKLNDYPMVTDDG